MAPQPDIETLVESVLFFKGGPMRMKDLAKAVGASPTDTSAALENLKVALSERGIRLVVEDDQVSLTTAPESKEAIEAMRREELEGPLGKAGLETLAIIVFRGPVSRSDIEYVRGVNCQSILRSLMVRGLIERIENPGDARSFLYRATVDLPAYLGVGALAELPDHVEIRGRIEKVFAERDAALKAPEPVEATPAEPV